MVIFLARVVAGYRGASEICSKTCPGTLLLAADLLEGIIREHAPARLLPPYSVGIEGVPPHHAFFADSTATELLTELNSLRPSRDPIQTSVDMAVSSGLGRTLNEAAALANDLRSTNIEPLHLLAAMIQCDADICERLNRHGVRLDAALAAIRSTDQ
jgi:hypothetical protein